MFDGTSVPAV